VLRNASKIEFLEHRNESQRLFSKPTDLSILIDQSLLYTGSGRHSRLEKLGELARGRMQQKKAVLHKALQGKVEEHHRLIPSQLFKKGSFYAALFLARFLDFEGISRCLLSELNSRKHCWI
jgi:hypothetical protein